MDIELNQNLARIIRTLEGQGMKPTKIAHAIGYTTTRQLYNSVDGKSLLSTKAVKGLIENLNVNPIYIFLGKGDMFLTAETEIETLRKENQEWIQRHNEAIKTVMALNEIIKKLKKRNDDLIELSSAAIKFHQGQKQEELPIEENDLREPVLGNIQYLRWLAEEKNEKDNDNDINDLIESKIGQMHLEWMVHKEKVSTKAEPDSSAKHDKK